MSSYVQKSLAEGHAQCFRNQDEDRMIACLSVARTVSIDGNLNICDRDCMTAWILSMDSQSTSR